MEKNRNKNKVYSVGIYARLSVDHNIKKESIASQIAIAKTYLEQQEEMILYNCYIDLGESGTHFKRTGFLQLMEDIRTKKINCVIVKDFSRFGRNYLEVGNYIDKIFPFLGVRFISVTDGFDSCREEESEIDRNLKNLINEMYAYDTARKVKQVKHLYQKQGNYIGSKAPYGYQIEKHGGKRGLIIDKSAFEIVEKIIQLSLEGKTQKEIVCWLYQHHVHRPSDYRRTGHIYSMEGEILLEWQKESIRQILYRFGDAIERGKKQENKSIIGWKEEWKERKKEKRNSHQTIWEELFYCGDCKQKLSVRKDLKKHIFFCNRAKRIDLLQCKKKQISEEVISTCIILLLHHTIQKGVDYNIERLNLKEYGQKKGAESIKKKELEIRRIEIQIISVKRTISENYKEYQMGVIGTEAFLIKKTEGIEKIESLKKQKEKKLQEIRKVEQQIEGVQGQMEIIQDWRAWSSDTIAQNILFFSDIIKRIELFSEKRIVVQFYIKR